MSVRNIFQQKALDKLRSPEELDKLFITVTPVGWVALGCVLLLIFSGLVWSIFGSIADKVGGVGLIVDSAGMANIIHPVSGKVIESRISIGDYVKKGQVVAILEQPELEREISRLRSEINITIGKNEMSTKVVQLNALMEKHFRESRVVSPYDGIIAEESINTGDYVSAGTSFAGVRLDQKSGDMIALIYVPVLEGKKIHSGMMAQVAPGSVNSSEYGTLVGKVIRISDYPVSARTIKNWTGNQEITNWILQNGGSAVMEVNIDLIKDESTPTGYLWSSVWGAPFAITPGTACTGTIVVKRQAPLVKAFNKFGQWLRSD